MPVSDYRIYTTDFDEIVEPNDVPKVVLGNGNRQPLSNRQIKRLKNSLACYKFSAESVKKLHDKIQARLKQQGIAASDLSALILVDNSGSMRGAHQNQAAAIATLVGTALEMAGAKSEVVGFTTTDWKGGRPREVWLETGKPQNPGRLNAVRYIIYKDFSQRWGDKSVSRNVALMTANASHLKENIDGEALLWADQRLKDSKAPVISTLLISDNDPMDDSTSSANRDDSYLRGHYKDTVGKLEISEGSNVGHFRLYSTRQAYSKTPFRNSVDIKPYLDEDDTFLDNVAQLVVPDGMKRNKKQKMQPTPP